MSFPLMGIWSFFSPRSCKIYPVLNAGLYYSLHPRCELVQKKFLIPFEIFTTLNGKSADFNGFHAVKCLFWSSYEPLSYFSILILTS